MPWRDGEMWLEADLLWFREQRPGSLAVRSLAVAGTATRFDPPRFGPVATGLDASRRRRLEAKAARRRRLATRTVPAVALVARLGHDAPDRRASAGRRADPRVLWRQTRRA